MKLLLEIAWTHVTTRIRQTLVGILGVAMGVGPEHMQDHLKLIPRQVVQIAKEDPHVLDSYDNFVAATFGPQ